MVKRIELDAVGEMQVDSERLWGAQTQRAIERCRISTERMPSELIAALALVKRACASVNRELGLLEPKTAQAIEFAAQLVQGGSLDHEFPLHVWQTGSGTQTNANINEVLANVASEYLGGPRGAHRRVHAGDHVNLGQSANDVFPTAMNVAASIGVVRGLLPALVGLRRSLASSAGSSPRTTPMLAATFIAVGNTSFADWPRFT